MDDKGEEGLAELDEKVVLAELLQLQQFLVNYDNPQKTAVKSPNDLLDIPINLIKDAIKHDALVAAHSRKALEKLRKRPEMRQKVSFMTKEEELVIRTTLNIEPALFILSNHYEHYYRMEIQHESQLGNPRQGGYTLTLMKRQREFIMGELEKIINTIRSLILLEESLKKNMQG